jgi:hypothetical protein
MMAKKGKQNILILWGDDIVPGKAWDCASTARSNRCFTRDLAVR